MAENLATQAGPDTSDRARLRQIIAERCFKKGDFTLASGKKSDVFFNLKPAMMDPEASNLLAEAILDVLRREGVRSVGGLAMGAVPLVASVCTKSYPDYPLEAFFVRKQIKDHGIMQQIDGNLTEGAEVVLLEDVVTTGGSVMIAVEAARAKGCKVKCILTVVDRMEGARENLEREGLRLESLYTREDFV
jgi:orotate phosphoribosyltransferase